VLQPSGSHRGHRPADDRPALPSPRLRSPGKHGGLAGAGWPDEHCQARRRGQCLGYVALFCGQVAGTLALVLRVVRRQPGLVSELGRDSERVLLHGEQFGGRPPWSVLCAGAQAYNVAVFQHADGGRLERLAVDGEADRQGLA
jgi:hypothetical protein